MTDAIDEAAHKLKRGHPGDWDKNLAAYRDAVLHAAAERIRRAPHDGTGDTWGWWDAAEIPDHCADLIDPDKQEQP